MSIPKETWFFCYDFRRGNGWKDYDNGLEWYFGEYFEHCRGKKLGEATPRYMVDEKSASLISNHFSSPKLIFILRNPIDRIYSQYLQKLSEGKESPTGSFRSFIEKTQNSTNNRPDYVWTGKYIHHLRRFEDKFSKKNIIIFLFNRFVKDTERVVKEVFQFLDVDTAFSPDTSIQHNTTQYPRNETIHRIAYKIWEPIERRMSSSFLDAVEFARSAVREWLLQDGTEMQKPEMDPSDRKYLREIYREPNQQLAEYLDRDLSHWT